MRLTDDGSENTLRNLAQVRHLVAQRDIMARNSMVEAGNFTLKYRFLFTFPLRD
ncbi:MAG: hypothetical protein J0L75_04950 [Spirochaetes bacterium]|nr:hypothetical protein [Spirochaetota bacterium]